MRALCLALLALAGCGAESVREDKVSANQLQRLSTPEQEPVGDPLETVRLQPLEPGDITHAGLSGPGCRFSIGGAVLVAAGERDAIARIGGETRHFAHAAPVGPSGGFFEDRQIGISIGRTDPAETAARALTGWPARITVTNRRNQAQLNREGIWQCGA